MLVITYYYNMLAIKNVKDYRKHREMGKNLNIC